MTVTRDPAEPREGLPPCTSLVMFDGRLAALINTALCGEPQVHNMATRFFVTAGAQSGSTAPGLHNPNCRMPQGQGEHTVYLETDDPAEAQAAFERGAEWVRTGRLE